jgi:hypothetical protein
MNVSNALIATGGGQNVHILLQSSIIVEDGTTLEENYPERESEQELMANQHNNEVANFSFCSFTPLLVTFYFYSHFRPGILLWYL